MLLFATNLSKGINPNEDYNDTQKKRILMGFMLPCHGFMLCNGWDSPSREIIQARFSLVMTTQQIGRRQSPWEMY